MRLNPFRLRHRIRQLADGRWVAEVRPWHQPFWLAVDAVQPVFAWGPGNAYFSDCLCANAAGAERALRRHLTIRYAAAWE